VALSSPGMKIGILVYDGFDELDAIGPYEVLRNAGAAEVRLVTLGAVPSVTASHGLSITPQAVLGEDAYDLLVIPGGGWNDRAPAGAYAEARRGELPAEIRRRHEQGAVVAAVCTGAMLVSAAGLLRGRPATTHQGALEELRAEGAQVIDARVVDDGDLLSCGGITSGIDLALWIVEREWGSELAAQVAREMEHDRRGPGWRAGAAR
jgi:transcriptional regulator GlxA family with amidase domain